MMVDWVDMSNQLLWFLNQVTTCTNTYSYYSAKIEDSMVFTWFSHGFPMPYIHEEWEFNHEFFLRRGAAVVAVEIGLSARRASWKHQRALCLMFIEWKTIGKWWFNGGLMVVKWD